MQVPEDMEVIVDVCQARLPKPLYCRLCIVNAEGNPPCDTGTTETFMEGRNHNPNAL